MKSKKLLTIILCFSMTIMAFGCASQKLSKNEDEEVTVVVSEDYRHYSNIEELAKKSDEIILGTIEDSKVVEINDIISTNDKDEKSNPGGESKTSNMVYTVYTVKIEESYKGKTKVGKTIEMKQTGGKLKDKNCILKDGVNFEDGKKYVMFLATYDGIPGELLNPIQSCYIYEEDIKEKAAYKDKELISVNKNNDLKLFTKDLEKIKSENKK